MKEILKEFETKTLKTIDVLTKDYAAIRAGRANPAVLDKVTVDYYGTPTPINQMAAISVAEARVLVITPWDKSTLKPIEKAIQTSDVGVNPQNDGTVIRLNFPALNEERRKELSKQISKMAEDSKVAVRSIRRDSNDKIKAKKKANEITEDDQKDLEKKIQDLTDKQCKVIDGIADEKVKEILSI